MTGAGSGEGNASQDAPKTPRQQTTSSQGQLSSHHQVVMSPATSGSIPRSSKGSTSERKTLEVATAVTLASPQTKRPLFVQAAENTRRGSHLDPGTGLANEAQAHKKKPCNCKHTHCLKLYCECFRAGVYCGIECNCSKCFNNVKHEEVRKRSVEQTLTRDPDAFRPKIATSPRTGLETGPVKHNKGCQCKKTGCLKRYCECYQANILCSDNCRCHDCKNTSFPGSEIGVLHHPSGSRIAQVGSTLARPPGTLSLKPMGASSASPGTSSKPGILAAAAPIQQRVGEPGAAATYSSKSPFAGLVQSHWLSKVGQLLLMAGQDNEDPKQPTLTSGDFADADPAGQDSPHRSVSPLTAFLRAPDDPSKVGSMAVPTQIQEGEKTENAILKEFSAIVRELANKGITEDTLSHTDINILRKRLRTPLKTSDLDSDREPTNETKRAKVTE